MSQSQNTQKPNLKKICYRGGKRINQLAARKHLAAAMGGKAHHFRFSCLGPEGLGEKNDVDEDMDFITNFFFLGITCFDVEHLWQELEAFETNLN